MDQGEFFRTRSTQQTSPATSKPLNHETTRVEQVTPALSWPSMRRSARAKSTLVYDQKYHPMDDFIRPSQAAKRRSLHGERPTPGNSFTDDASEGSGSDVGSILCDESSDGESQPHMRGRKRKRSRSEVPEPTRRSSRRRTQPKMSYDMSIHPQDSDLRRVGACDGSNSSPSPSKHASFRRTESPRRSDPLGCCETICQSTSPVALKGETSHFPGPLCRLLDWDIRKMC